MVGVRLTKIIVNQARALRVAEIINDYRTLLVHISQQNVPAPAADYWEDGYKIIRECLAEAQALMSSNYMPSIPAAGGSNEEAEKVQLQRYAWFSTADSDRIHS